VKYTHTQYRAIQFPDYQAWCKKWKVSIQSHTTTLTRIRREAIHTQRKSKGKNVQCMLDLQDYTQLSLSMETSYIIFTFTVNIKQQKHKPHKTTTIEDEKRRRHFVFCSHSHFCFATRKLLCKIGQSYIT
jgi:hypothetical protein